MPIFLHHLPAVMLVKGADLCLSIPVARIEICLPDDGRVTILRCGFILNEATPDAALLLNLFGIDQGEKSSPRSEPPRTHPVRTQV